MDLVVDGCIYEGSSYGGIARVYAEILPRMCEMDPSLHVSMLTSGRPRGHIPAHSRIRHVRVPAVERVLRPEQLWGSVVPRVRAAVQRAVVGEARGRVWHSTYYTRPLAWKGPVVVTAVDLIHERFPELFGDSGRDMSRRKRACLKAADAIIAISRATAEDIRHFYGVEDARIRVIPLACSDAFHQGDGDRPLAVGTSRPFLLYVGIRSRYKNTDLLLRAYARWSHRRDVDLVVVGRPWSPAERDELASLGVRDKVHLLGYVEDTQLRGLYRRAVALVYPSLYEGFGLPLLEAMGSGSPVVASRIPSTLEVAGNCPVYFDPADSVDALLHALDVVLIEGRDPERIQLGRACAATYSWDRTAELTLGVYASLAGTRPHTVRPRRGADDPSTLG